MLEFGDETLIGDRGVTLSGGQRARVNLARAIYSDADIYLLDDPLAAVDAKVATRLYDECINGYLKDKTRILVTHQIRYLQNAAHIVFMDGGAIVADGDFETIRSFEHPFLANIASADNNDKDEDDDEKLNNTKAHKYDDEKDGERVQEKNLETKKEGEIGWRNFWNYIRASDTVYLFFLWIVVKLTAVSLFMLADIQFSLIGDTAEAEKAKCVGSSDAECELIFENEPVKGKICAIRHFVLNKHLCSDQFFLYLYFILAHAVCLLCAYLLNYHVLCNSGQNIHDMAITGVIKSPIRFFDQNPSGRILNRFSKDMAQMDELLPVALEDAITLFARTIGVLIINAWANWFSVAIAIPTIISFILLRQYYIKTARDVKRLDGVMRSPMYNHVSNSVQGYLSIKAYGLQKETYAQFNELQDIHGGAWLLFCGTSRWLAFRLDTIISIYIFVVSVIMIPISQSDDLGVINLTPATIGLSLSQAYTMLGSMQWAVRQSSEAENYLTSVERIFEYAALKPEPSTKFSSDSVGKDDEDSTNFNRQDVKAQMRKIIALSENQHVDYMNKTIAVNKYSYRHSGQTAVVLNNLNFTVKLGEKIGIVGRTGAGKSSLISSLFRLGLTECGTVEFDGCDIEEIDLSQLRASISIIPQEPVIYWFYIR